MASGRIDTRAVGLELNWPLFTGGYQSGRVQEATALLVRAQARSDQQCEADHGRCGPVDMGIGMESLHQRDQLQGHAERPQVAEARFRGEVVR